MRPDGNAGWRCCHDALRERKDSLYAILVSAGYLKIASPLVEGTCKVAIPNHEIAQVFVGKNAVEICR